MSNRQTGQYGNEDISAVHSTFDEEEANKLIEDGWLLLHGGIAHKDQTGFQAKPYFVLGKKDE